MLEMLKTGGYSLLVRSRGEIHSFNRPGVADLMALLAENPGLLVGAAVADKVVGKAAAALMVLGGVARVEALTMSLPAKEMLDASGVANSGEVMTDHIENRDGTGWCPMELCCRDCKTPEECKTAIEKKIIELKNRRR